jgi:DNA-binding response OmpR family regulator
VASTSKRPLILIVEDDYDTREAYRIAVRAAGFQVVAVADGLRALRAIDTEPPALIVLDLSLPILSGRDVALEVRAHAETAHIPILIVTGYDASDLEGNGNCVLRKPSDPDEVVRTVKRCLRQAAFLGV